MENIFKRVIEYCDQETLSVLIHTNKKIRNYIFDNRLLKKEYKYKVDIDNINFDKKVNPFSYYVKYNIGDTKNFANIINEIYLKLSYSRYPTWLTSLVDWIIISNDHERILLQHYLHKDLKYIVDKYYKQRIITRFFKNFDRISRFHTLLVK